MSKPWMTGCTGRWTTVVLSLLLAAVQAEEALPELQKPELAPGVVAAPAVAVQEAVAAPEAAKPPQAELKVVVEPAVAAPVAVPPADVAKADVAKADVAKAPAEPIVKIKKPREPVKFSLIQIGIWNPVQMVPETADIYGLRLDLGYGRNADVYGIDVGVYNSCAGNLRGLQLGLLWNEVESAGHPGVGGFQLGGIYKSAQEITGIQGLGIIAKAETVNGLQLLHIINLVGSDVTGIQALAAYNRAQVITGAQCGVYNQAEKVTGWQGSVLASLTENAVTGWQDSWGYSHAHQVDGVQIGGIMADTDKIVTGWQGGLVTSADRVYGVQSGAWNMTGYVSGMQIGLVNISPVGLYGREGVKGVQFGLIFNSAPAVEGVQIGLFNFTRVLSGVQIGLCNIVSDTSQYLPLINANF